MRIRLVCSSALRIGRGIRNSKASFYEGCLRTPDRSLEPIFPVLSHLFASNLWQINRFLGK